MQSCKQNKDEASPLKGPAMLENFKKKILASSTERNTHMNFCKHYSANAILNRHTSMNSNLTFITILNNATKEFSRFM